MLKGGPQVPKDPPRYGAHATPRIEPQSKRSAVSHGPSQTPPSLFRPKRGIDQSVLEENKRLVETINRRKVLRGAVSLGALSMLTGCDVTSRGSVQSVLKTVSQWNDRAQAALFRPNHLAPTYAPSQVVKPPRFNAYYDVEDVAPVDADTWKLELAGLIEDKRPWTASPDLRAARAGDHRPPHLRRGLGLHRPVVRREPAASFCSASVRT